MSGLLFSRYLELKQEVVVGHTPFKNLFFFIEMYRFIQERHIKLIKSDSKDILLCYKKIFQMNAVIFYFS